MKKYRNLISLLFDLVSYLYKKTCPKKFNIQGPIGVAGPSSNPKEKWSLEIGKIQSIINMLQSILLQEKEKNIDESIKKVIEEKLK